MIAEKTKQNANYFRIVTILRSLLNSGEISKNEYNRAKAYGDKRIEVIFGGGTSIIEEL